MSYSEYFNPKIETMSLAEIREMQESKFKRQMEYVYNNSLFYKNKFDEAGVKPKNLKSLDDLVNVPFTTKNELRESQVIEPPMGLHTCAPLDDVIRIHASSGTTGTPSYVGVTKHDSEIWNEVVARCYYSQGVRPNSRLIMGFAIGFFVGGVPLVSAMERIGAMLIPIGSGASDRIVTSIKNIKAEMITCTPSYAIYLADYIKNKAGLDPRTLGIKHILCGAEPGGGVPGIRKKIEDEWGATVSESLGNADIMTVYAAECHQRDGNHFLGFDYVYLELINPETGERIGFEDGAVGELVATHLDRQCVPLVRFRTRDRVEVYNKPCSCGRNTFKVRCIGRTDDMLIVLGVNVWPSAIRDVVAGFRPKVTGEIQIVLDKPGHNVVPPLKITVEHEAGVENLSELKKELEVSLREKLIFHSAVTLVPPGTLPRFEMKANLIRKLYEE